jgi:hypothetical protein
MCKFMISEYNSGGSVCHNDVFLGVRTLRPRAGETDVTSHFTWTEHGSRTAGPTSSAPVDAITNKSTSTFTFLPLRHRNTEPQRATSQRHTTDKQHSMSDGPPPAKRNRFVGTKSASDY